MFPAPLLLLPLGGFCLYGIGTITGVSFDRPIRTLFADYFLAIPVATVICMLIAFIAYALPRIISSISSSSSTGTTSERASRNTDGVFESALEKMDKGIPLNEREAKRIEDILNFKQNEEAKRIERKHGER